MCTRIDRLASWAALAALLTGALAGCSGAKQQAPDLVLIVLDTVGPAHMSVYGYDRPTTPFLERFGQTATRFDRAYSTSTWTLPAHASAFTGLSPVRHGADQVSQQLSVETALLAERLAQGGYQTAGFSNNPWVAASRGTARGFAHFEELFRARGGVPRGVERHATVTSVTHWLRELRQPDVPAFLFVNLTEAHYPYAPPWQQARPFFASRERWQAALRRVAALNPLNLIRSNYVGSEPLTPDDVAAGRDLYDAEIRYADAIAERIVREVERASTRERLVVIASDHGENFGEHGHMGHAFALYDSTLRIALLAQGPGFAPGSADRRLVEIADLFPTFLAAAGLPVPDDIDGRDLRGAPDPERAISALYAHPVQALEQFPDAHRDDPSLRRLDRELRAAILGSHKLILGSDGSEAVFDLSADPAEARPLEQVPESLLARLRAAAGTPRRAPSSGAPPAAVDDETRRALESMGYLRGDERDAASAGSGSGAPGTEPQPQQ